MRNMLAIWREHGIDDAMRTAWERGIVLAGLSAGAMCWFEGGVSMSGGQPEVVHGIGLLPGILSVHLDGESERLPVYEQAVATGALPPGYAADDGAALVFHGTRLAECVASRPARGCCGSRPTATAGRVETAQPVRAAAGRRSTARAAEPAYESRRRLGAAGAAGRAPPLGLKPCRSAARPRAQRDASLARRRSRVWSAAAA